LSLRGRLLLAVGAVALVALVAADVTTYSLLRSFLFTRVDQTLDTTYFSVTPLLRARPALPLGAGATPRSTGSAATTRASGATGATAATGATPPGQAPSGSLARLAPGTFVQERTAAGAVVPAIGQPAIAPGGRSYTPRLPAHIAGLGRGSGAPVYFTVSSRQAGGPQFRVRAATVAGGRQLIVAAPLGDTVGTLHRLLAVELAVTIAALLAAGLLGWWLVRVGLRPLRAMEQSAEAIAAGEPDQRVAGENDHTEVGRLARALNVMLGRIQAAFAERDATESELRASEERMRHFVADASHELRTPLAAVSAYAELFERGADHNQADLGRVMRGISNESGRMKALVEDLLLLARLDEGRPLAREPVELVGLVAEAVQTAQTVGAEWPVRLDAALPVETSGDRDRLRQVLDNLLVNVRTHTPAGTTTTIGLSGGDGVATIAVADDGPGLDADTAAQVFERFYRADPSRSRAHGGAGLGLAIVKAIVTAHGGEVSAGAAPGGGALFTVRLPIA
jgi:two-component system OmpR family sensor kinase